MFDQHFEVFLADTPESKAINYDIRYQVYCEEMGFENRDDFPLQKELDSWDKCSVHFIARHNHTGTWIGAMRLVTHHNNTLPMEQYFPIKELADDPNPQASVEYSRLCILKSMRRRATDFYPPLGLITQNDDLQETEKIKLFDGQRRINRHIIWGLIRAASLYCQENNIKNWYFLTTPGLVQLLNRKGLKTECLGDSLPDIGGRIPYKMDINEMLLNRMWRDYKKGYQLYSETIKTIDEESSVA